jgi:hypothetical protein
MRIFLVIVSVSTEANGAAFQVPYFLEERSQDFKRRVYAHVPSITLSTGMIQLHTSGSSTNKFRYKYLPTTDNRVS